MSGNKPAKEKRSGMTTECAGELTVDSLRLKEVTECLTTMSGSVDRLERCSSGRGVMTQTSSIHSKLLRGAIRAGLIGPEMNEVRMFDQTQMILGVWGLLDESSVSLR